MLSSNSVEFLTDSLCYISNHSNNCLFQKSLETLLFLSRIHVTKVVEASRSLDVA